MGALDAIKSLEIVQVSEVDNLDQNHYVQYLEYVDVVKDVKLTKPSTPGQSVYVDDLLDDGFIDPSTHSKIKHGEQGEAEIPMVSLSLVLQKVIVDFQDEKVETSPGEDPQTAVVDFLLKKIILKIRELAAINKAELEKQYNSSLNNWLTEETPDQKFLGTVEQRTELLDYKFKEEEKAENVFGGILRRKLISKILRASNTIATRTRIGPGTFVIAKREYIDSISKYSPNRYLYPLEFQTTVSNMKMLVCDDLGDEVIVGRLGTTEEAGIKLISNNDSLEKNLTFNETDISGVNIRYALDSYGPKSYANYMSFKLEK